MQCKPDGSGADGDAADCDAMRDVALRPDEQVVGSHEIGSPARWDDDRAHRRDDGDSVDVRSLQQPERRVKGRAVVYGIVPARNARIGDGLLEAPGDERIERAFDRGVHGSANLHRDTRALWNGGGEYAAIVRPGDSRRNRRRQREPHDVGGASAGWSCDCHAKTLVRDRPCVGVGQIENERMRLQHYTSRRAGAGLAKTSAAAFPGAVFQETMS